MQKLILGVLVVIALATSGVLTQANVTGSWQFIVELDIGSGEPTFVFEQDGEMLTGTYEGTFGEAPVTGMVKGDQIEFRFGAQDSEAVYVGTIDGDTMSGTCDYGGVGEGTWEAGRE